MFSRLLAVLAFVGLATPSLAVPVTYSYTGANYSDFENPNFVWYEPFNSSMSLTASITLSEALLPDTRTSILSWTYDLFGNWSASIAARFLSATIFDGITTYQASLIPGNAPTFPPICCISYMSLALVTDSSGDIVDWSLAAQRLAPRGVQKGWHATSSASGETAFRQEGPNETYRAASSSPGIWSMAEYAQPPATVPLPAPLLFLASGLGLLALLRRHPGSLRSR
jgi:hypothetical protein